MSCVISQVCPDSSSRKGAYRFLSNAKVTEASLIEDLENQCKSNVEGKDVIAFCDTTSFNFTSHKGRITDFTGLGSIGNINGVHPLGFFAHPILVHERESGNPLGISGLKLWCRKEERKRSKAKRYETKDIVIEDKESYKWLEPCSSSKENSLQKAKHITFVMDREGDIMEVFDRLPNERTDVLTRVMHDRTIQTHEREYDKLYSCLSKQTIGATAVVKVQGRKRKKRNAVVEIRSVKCTLQWPKRQKVSYKNNDKGVQVTLIEVRERTHNGHKDEPPLIWRLVSTKELEDIEQVKEEIRIYEQRWRIEEFFKLLKSDGYDIESTELESGPAIRKLTLILMKTSIKIQQLKAARDGNTEMVVDDVFTEQEITCLEMLNKKVSGNTDKQRNPHGSKNLAWASWIIARLGGWKEFYAKNRPPGNKTLKLGLDKFESIMLGYLILKNKDVS